MPVASWGRSCCLFGHAALPDRATGNLARGPTGPYWYSPAALDGMTEGQVLDSDPITGEQLAVSAVRQGEVVMQRQKPGIVDWFTFDNQSGMLAAVDSQIAQSGISFSLELAGSR